MLPVRIFIVDDDLMLLSAMRKILQQDYEVKVNDGSPGALEIAIRFNPDVVLVDFLLGWTNGIDLIEQLREVLPESNLILMTARLEPEISEEAFAAGADWFLAKSEVALLFSILSQIERSRGLS